MSNPVLLTALADLLADGEPHNTGPEFGKASPFGLLVIVLLLLGTFGLVWSMNRQLRKVPSSFDDIGSDDTGTGPDGAPADEQPGTPTDRAGDTANPTETG